MFGVWSPQPKQAHTVSWLHLKSFSGIPAQSKNHSLQAFFSYSTYGCFHTHSTTVSSSFFLHLLRTDTICFALIPHTLPTSRSPHRSLNAKESAAAEYQRNEERKRAKRNTKTNPLRTVEYDPVWCMARTFTVCIGFTHQHGNSAFPFRDVTIRFSLTLKTPPTFFPCTHTVVNMKSVM